MSANYAADKEVDGVENQLGGTTYERLAKVFVWADTDGNGSLSVQEFKTAFQKANFKKFLETLGLGCLHEFFDDFDNGDKDGSSQLDFEEFIEYIDEKNGALEIDGKPSEVGTAEDALIRDIYDAIDSGRYSSEKQGDKAGDGISKAEFKRAFKTSKKLQKLIIKLGAAVSKYNIELFQSFKCEDADDDNLLNFEEFKIYLEESAKGAYQSGSSG